MINSEILIARFWMLGGTQLLEGQELCPWPKRKGIQWAYKGVTVHVKTNFDGSFNGNGSWFAFAEAALGKNVAQPHGNHQPLQSRVHMISSRMYTTHLYSETILQFETFYDMYMKCILTRLLRSPSFLFLAANCLVLSANQYVRLHASDSIFIRFTEY